MPTEPMDYYRLINLARIETYGEFCHECRILQVDPDYMYEKMSEVRQQLPEGIDIEDKLQEARDEGYEEAVQDVKSALNIW